MSAVTFDTLGYFERLKAAGVPEAQAKVQADALRELADNRLVTKEHLDIRLTELKVEMQAMKNELIKWMVGGFIAFGAFLFAAMAFLK